MSFLSDIFSRKNRPVLDDDLLGLAGLISAVRASSLHAGAEPKFVEANAYKTAMMLAEIFCPLDIISDAVASLDYRIVDVGGDVVDNPPANITRLMKQPNVFSTFSQMIYDASFILLSDGNLVGARAVPSAYDGVVANVDRIQSVSILKPGNYTLQLKSDVQPFFAAQLNDLLARVTYSDFGRFIEILPDNVVIVGASGMPGDDLRYPSPLMAVSHNIENLFAVYQARYKIYIKNGMAGILTRKASSYRSGNELGDVVLGDTVSREEILRDVMNRFGLTGEKLAWGVSSIPLEFVKTVASIAELQPFEEAREDALMIAGAMGVDKDLLPRASGVTYANKDAAMLRLYTGVGKSMADDIAEFMTKLMMLDTIGLRFEPDFSNVDILQKEKSLKADADTKIVDLLLKLKSEGVIEDGDFTEITEKIINNYKI